MKNGKTRKVNGVDCHKDCFAYVGNPDETNSWHGCIHVLGDTAKTINAIKNALARFPDMKGIPDSERETVWHTIRGAALALGIRVEERAKSEASAQAEPPPVKPPKTRAEELLSEKELKEIAAMADTRADLFLKSLGLD